ncbi:MAG: hypothetical protein RR824_09950 [Clostridia bacterium]
MKKLIALILSLMLCLTAFAALAETAPAVVAGETIEFQDGLSFEPPTGWVELEVSAEDEAAGVQCILQDPASKNTIVVTWAEAIQESTLEALAESLKATYTEVEPIELNGIPAIFYTVADKEASGFCFMDGNGGLYSFTFAPTSNADLATVLQTMLPTIQFLDAAEAAPAA